MRIRARNDKKDLVVKTVEDQGKGRKKRRGSYQLEKEDDHFHSWPTVGQHLSHSVSALEQNRWVQLVEHWRMKRPIG